MTMTAVDYDDPSEGTNARLIYSIEKNVIEEETGSPIFEIESETGVIKTAVCCLDRERTPDYSIQVVAMDGGGLKGEILNFKSQFSVRINLITFVSIVILNIIVIIFLYYIIYFKCMRMN